MSEKRTELAQRVGLSETARLEAFSDGVIAIAITLLVLELRPPQVQDAGLWQAILHDWTTFVAYLAGFLTVGMFWLNHHRLFKLIRACDDWLLIFNLLLLLAISFINYPTALLSEYLGTPNATMAMAVYTATTLLIAIAFNVLWRYAVHADLLEPDADPRVVRAMNRGYWVGPIFFVIAFIVAFISVYVSLAIAIGVLAFFVLPSNNPLTRFHARTE